MEDLRSKTMRVRQDYRELDNQSFWDYNQMMTDRRKQKLEAEQAQREKAERIF